MNPWRCALVVLLWLLWPAVVWGQVPDARPTFDVVGFSGMTVDTFAADDLRAYLNPQEATGERLRWTAGLRFAYRVPVTLGQVWALGTARYGVRSTDVDCAANPELGLCEPFTGRRDAWLYVLRHARSLEASGGLRWEFVALNGGSDAPAALYVKAVAGLLTVADAGSDALDQHAVTVGGIVTAGAFQGSYVDVGWGRSDVYALTPTPRLRVDGYFNLGRFRAVSPFVQIVLDADLTHGADSIQTHVGAAVDLRRR